MRECDKYVGVQQDCVPDTGRDMSPLCRTQKFIETTIVTIADNWLAGTAVQINKSCNYRRTRNASGEESVLPAFTGNLQRLVPGLKSRCPALMVFSVFLLMSFPCTYGSCDLERTLYVVVYWQYIG
jgi:hypothetical protein